MAYRTLVIDLAIVGRWNNRRGRHGVDGTANGAMPVRLAYAAMHGETPYETGVLILQPNAMWPPSSRESLECGGITTNGLAQEGRPPAEFNKHRVWSLFDQADCIAAHFIDFHAQCLSTFAETCGVDLQVKRQAVPTLCTCARSTMLTKIPSQTITTYKPPSLVEASAILCGFDLEIARQQALTKAEPTQAFGHCQVSAVAVLVTVIRKQEEQDRVASDDDFAMA